MPEINDGDHRAIPIPSIRRLPLYLRLLKAMRSQGRDVVSCTRIAEELGLVPVQVRKDLALTGVVGRPKTGYEISPVIDGIETLLGWKNTSDAFLVGAGSLGTALLGYEGFQENGLNIVAAFDTDGKRIGKRIHGREVLPWGKFQDLAQRMHVRIGVLTTPGAVAQEIADQMVDAGVRAIWNFTPAALELPENVVVEDIRLTVSLAVLTTRLRQEFDGASSVIKKADSN